MHGPNKAPLRAVSCRRAGHLGIAVATAAVCGVLAAKPTVLAQPVAASPASVLRVHARSLDATLQILRTYLPIPLKPEAALDSLLGVLGSQVVLSAPADLVVALDQKSVDNPAPPQWVIACTLRSLDEARKVASSANLSMENQGKWTRLQLYAGGDTWRCLLGPDVGGAARLACGHSERSRDELAPYAVTLAPLRIKSDLRAELSIETLVRTYEALIQRGLQMASILAPQKLQLGNPMFDRGLTDLTQTLVGQVGNMAADLRQLALDISLTNTGAEAMLAYQLGSETSWWGQADALAAQQSTTVTPSIFWALPTEAGSASFAVSELRYGQQLLKLLQPLIDGFLTHDGLAAADRHALSELLRAVPMASGRLTTAVAEVAVAGAEAQPRGERVDWQQLLAGSVYVLTSDGADRLAVSWLQNVVAAYKRPGVQAYMRAKWKQLGIREPLPVLRVQPAGKPLGPGAQWFSLSLSLPAGLDKGALGRGQVAAASPKPAPRATPIVLHLLTAEQGGRTWMAAGSDPRLLATRLSEQLSIASERSLMQRPDLEALRQPGLRSGGFTSLRSLARYLEGAMSLSRRRSTRSADGNVSASDIASIFNRLPHHGETTVVHFSRVRRTIAGGDGGPLIGEWTVRIPRTALEDLVALAMHLAM